MVGLNLIAYLAYSTASQEGQRATTVSFQLILSWAFLFASPHVVFTTCSSEVTPLRHEFFGLPLFLFSWGFHSKACFFKLDWSVQMSWFSEMLRSCKCLLRLFKMIQPCTNNWVILKCMDDIWILPNVKQYTSFMNRNLISLTIIETLDSTQGHGKEGPDGSMR